MKSVTFVLCLLVLGAHSLLVFAVDCEIGGHQFKTGEKYTPEGRCLQYTCKGPKQVTALGCPAIASLRPCKMEEDLSKPYPGCCPKFNC
ncbi:uncharacterized protein LOC6725653 [Drosophila simulans]|uniref:GD16000 n=1 Tax=Drosophila simulans TaxID=7240 RepID=B4R2R9_DROSI|nr:uncharacterized protein LOC6725653 [Drosophila simulans]EDX17618.1 GD16000 [Drosophila simulans]KMZ09201.1 uncharacterized protein Dsimw501_GD16000 [Drosophila simulans]